MRIAIVGSRDWTNTALVERTVRYIARLDINSVIVSGAGGSVDTYAESAANTYELAKMIFPAKWRYYEKAVGNSKVAGPARNAQIAETADIAVIFWDGESRGTRSVHNLLESHGKQRLIVYPSADEQSQADMIKKFLDDHLKGGKQ